MSPELAYFMKVNLAIAIFYAFYRLFFYKDTFFRLRRIALLAFFAVAFLYPLFNIQAWIKEQEPIVEVAALYATILPEMDVANAPVQTDWLHLFYALGLYGYAAGVGILLVRFGAQLSSIFLLAAHCPRAVINGMSVHVLDKAVGPFSFFRFIFIDPQCHTPKETDEILAHENTHVRQYHSVDVLVGELLSIICWVNPFVWLLKREVRHNLEYLADNTVIQSGYDSKSYQYHLLGLAHHRATTHLYNSFNVLPLKNRISMMNKKRSRSIGQTKYLLFVPLAAVLMLLSNIEAVARVTRSFAEQITQATDPNIKSRGTVLNEKNEAILQDVTVKSEKQKDQVFTVVEKMPTYPGGEKALLTYISSSLRYPLIAQENGIQGRVTCVFVINKDGSITNVEVARGVDPSLDSEAVRVISSMKGWIPGEQRGQKVAVKYTMPITFGLDNINTATKTTTVATDKPIITTQKDKDGNPVYTVVQHMPQYPGGDAEMLKFINRTLKYPLIASENGIQGRVICSFTVNKDGSIGDVKVMRGVDPSLDLEACRILKLLPNWTPGMQQGEAVAVRYTVPVTFRLPESSAPEAK